MKRSLRGLVAIVRIAFEADARLALATTASLFLGIGNLFGVAISLKLVVDGALQQDVGKAVLGGVVAAIALAGGISFLPIGATVSLALQERISALIDQKLMSMTASVPSLELQDQPEYQSKLQLLLDDRFSLNVVLVVTLNSLLFGAIIIATAVILGLQQPLLGLFPLLALPTIWLGILAEGRFRKAQDATGEERRLGNALFNLSLDLAAGKELRIFGLSEELMSRQAVAERAVASALDRASWIGSGLRALGWTMFILAYAVAVYVVVLRATRGLASAGDVILTIAIAAPITFIMSNMGQQLSLLQSALRTADRYQWLSDLAKEAAIPPSNAAPVPSALRSGIRLERVGFQYPGTDRKVLSDISIELPAGAVVALVGENGAGKTTLVKLLCHLYQPTEGQITIDGVALSRIPPTDWRRHISSGFQDFCQFEVLARETIGLGDIPRITDRQAVTVAMERAGGSDVLNSLPSGLETQLGKDWEGGVDLSTGQWQKMALSRALMRDDPILLVLDEPTASLDAATEHALFERFAGAAREGKGAGNRIVVLVSHRFSTVRMADLIVVLKEGKILEAGNHAELLANQGLYSELYELQARGYR